MSPPAPRTARLAAVAGLLFNAFSWGVSWWPFRQMQAQGLHPLWLTAIIFGGAVALLLAVRPRALGELLRTRSLWWLVLAAGGTNACFNWAMSTGDVVRVVLLFYLMPLWAVLLAWPLLGERPGPAALARVALALAGAGVVLWPTGAGGLPVPRNLPEWLGLAGGAFFALNNVLLRREAARSESARALAMFAGGMGVALLLALPLAPLPPPPAWGWVLATAALTLWFLASNLTLQYGAARLPAHTTAVVMLSEVAFASASALWLGGGQMGPREALGAAMILAAAGLAALRRD